MPLERFWRPLGDLGASLEASGASGTVFGEVLFICAPPLGGPWGGLGRPGGTLWDAFGALEDLQEGQKVRLVERCPVHMHSEQIFMRFDTKFDDFGIDFAPVFPPKMK